MSKTIGFSLVGAGFLVIIVSFFFRNSLLAGISPSILGVIAIAFVVAGVVLLKLRLGSRPELIFKKVISGREVGPSINDQCAWGAKKIQDLPRRSLFNSGASRRASLISLGRGQRWVVVHSHI